MRVSKRVRFEDLGMEFRLLPQKIGEAATLSLQMPWMEAAAKAFCPVETGTLMGTIRWVLRGAYEAALIAGGLQYINPKTGRPVDYARYVHEGTSKMAPRPFLLQAIIQQRLRYAREMLRKTTELF